MARASVLDYRMLADERTRILAVATGQGLAPVLPVENLVQPSEAVLFILDFRVDSVKLIRTILRSKV